MTKSLQICLLTVCDTDLCRHRDVEANDDALYKKTFCDVHKDFSVVVITHVTHVLTVHSYLLIGITEIAAEMFGK